MKSILTIKTIIFLSISIISFNTIASSSDEKPDNTGTNPVDFQRDIRFYNEYSALNTSGDGNQNVSTLEFRTPFAGGKWQWRVRARQSFIDADLNDDGIDDIDDSGQGDVDMRFLTVPILNMAKREAFAFGLEVFLDTASEPSLGSGTTSLGPQMFYVKFLKNGLFAPGVQYKFSVDEDTGRSDVDKFLIDLNYLRMAKDKKSWFFTDPQIVIDQEADVEFGIVDFEFGWMMVKWFDHLKGQSVYIRPSVGVGKDRPTDGSIEVGYKIIGW
ncbi:hypothetical protein JYU12_00125 [bacterium AH-315-K03]|nr:hypothetical protein [bacterium AH-315-K03]